MGNLIIFPDRKPLKTRLTKKSKITSLWHYDTLRRLIERTQRRRAREKDKRIAERREEIARGRIKKMISALKKV